MKLITKQLEDFTLAQYEAARLLLPKERLSRIDKIATMDDRRRSVLGESLARQMLEAYTGTPAGEIVITYGSTGKPFAPQAHFSIAHSGDFVACAVDMQPIGIDLEVTRPLNVQLAPACCTPAEIDHLDALPPGEQGFELLRLWVLKESSIKCLGQDLRQMSQHEFAIHSNENIISSNKFLNYRLYQSPKGYFLAVCRQTLPPNP